MKDSPSTPIRSTLFLLFAYSLLTLPLFGQSHHHHDPRALAEDPRLAQGQIAPLLEGLGEHHHPVTTESDRAQIFFDQGLKLTYGFNHLEALRAFKEAARLDPDCAMAYWGWALVLGPNLNLPMRPDVAEQAWHAARMAMKHRKKASKQERGYIEAIAARYAEDADDDRKPLDQAYADAMKKLHERYPEDNDAATLYAAALMNLSPWNYWTRDRRPKRHTEEILSTLEQVVEKDPQHEGALHYYIHLIEPVDPMRGEAAADALRGLTPGAGHLVHMPSHIYMQLGRFADAYEANTKAAEADEGYITQCRAQGIYPLGYYPHNIHFLAWAAVMQGKSEAALAAARKVASKVPQDLHGDDWALYQTFLSIPLYTMVRFGMWDEILAEPRPRNDAPFWTAIWHYARGLAHIRRANQKRARRELAAVQTIREDSSSEQDFIGFSRAETLLSIAAELLLGEIATSTGRYGQSISHLEKAVRLQDSLPYNEPPDWYYPTRHTLGAILLEAGLPEEAETVYWQDLRKNRENGYALFGVWQSLVAQDRDTDAAEIRKRFDIAWSAADVKLASSRF